MPKSHSLTLAERLDRYSMPEPNRGCVLWTGHCNEFGYGKIRIRKMKFVHRVAWELANGPIPAGICVCHHCDVPSCINPDHLFLGTHADNMTDRDRKKRGGEAKRRAERNGKAKLTEAKVRAIRSDKRFSRLIALEMNLCTETVARVKRREIWSHV
jgi:hypothetical protein